MGHDDLYPFVLAPKVTEKLAFVDRLVRRLMAQKKTETPRGTVTGASSNTARPLRRGSRSDAGAGPQP